MSTVNPKIILIDMDGVIANFELGFFNNWRKKYPDESFIPLEKRKSLLVIDDYPKHLKDKVLEIYQSPNFFQNLPSITGAIEALAEIAALGHYVFICTSPLSHYQNCVLEKYLWVEKNLSKDWTKKIILTKDKTLIKADYLIDDWYNQEGIANRSWQLILFDQPYNRDQNSLKRMTWSTWKSVLKL